jgi:O-antigen ligase
MEPVRVHSPADDRGDRLLAWIAWALAAVTPWSISGTEILLGLGVVWLGWSVVRRRGAWCRSALDVPLAAFAIAWILAAFAADRSPLALVHASHMWVIVAAPFAAAALRTARHRARAAAILLASESLLGLYATYEHLTGHDPLTGRPVEKIAQGYLATGTFSHHLTLAGHAMLACSVGLVVLATSRSARARFVACAGTAGAGLALLWSFGRSAWIGMVVATPFAVFGAGARRRRATVLAMSAFVLSVLLVPALRSRLVQTLAQDVVGPRLRLWQTSLRIVRDHPLLGIGPGHWPAVFPEYKVPGFYLSTAHPHSDLLTIAVNAGVIGLGAFVALWASVIAHLVRHLRRFEGRSVADGPARTALVASVAVLVGGLFQCFQTDAEVAILLWGVVGVGLGAVADETRRAAASPERTWTPDASRRATPVSAVIVARDAERTLARCLASLSWVEEIVVVLDPRSNDRTEEIARSYGARIVTHEWCGHVAQKNFGLSLARHDWVLALDADEEISADLQAEITRLQSLPGDADVVGYELERRSYYLGRWISHSGWTPDRKLRLVDRRCARWDGVDPHDRLTTTGRVQRLTGALYHYTYAGVGDHLARTERYSTIAAEALYASGRRARVWDVVMRPPFRFVYTYVVRAGFVDGYAGFVIASVGAYGVLAKYLRLRECGHGAATSREGHPPDRTRSA